MSVTPLLTAFLTTLVTRTPSNQVTKVTITTLSHHQERLLRTRRNSPSVRNRKNNYRNRCAHLGLPPSLRSVATEIECWLLLVQACLRTQVVQATTDRACAKWVM
jgi:hypothetical protein